MSDADFSNWYLVRTKPHKERWVFDQLKRITQEPFLPLLRSKTRCFGRLTTTVKPLFPCYVFSRFNLKTCYYDVKYTPGVHSLVGVGGEPVVVSKLIVEEIRRRGENGIVEIQPPALGHGQRITIVDGPFRGFQAIFDRYLSSSERVAILLDAIGASSIRVVLPLSCVAE
ncbi:MAG TPA: transcription termination/antitermination NusG family protein [Candidatus Binataceae bacterium]|nr:transcription termination/antitermination NusG family protein [Candidatus Binataceae bacterium]